MYAEPICEPTDVGRDGLAKLLEAHDSEHSKKVLFSEIRPIKSLCAAKGLLTERGYKYFDYSNYIQNLGGSIAPVQSRAKKMLQKVRSSIRRGAEVQRLDATKQNIARAYRVIQHSYYRAQVPRAPIEVFMSAAECLPEGVLCIRMLRHQGQDVAAAIGLSFGDRYFAWYNGSTRPAALPATTGVLVWDEIQQAHQAGHSYYDFGGAGWPKKSYGPRVFKSRFKGTLTNHGRYRKVYSPFKLNVARAGYFLLRGKISPRTRLFPNSEMLSAPASDGGV